jgi:hypothetical protein
MLCINGAPPKLSALVQAIEKPATSKLIIENSTKRIFAAAKHVGMVRVASAPLCTCRHIHVSFVTFVQQAAASR